MTDSKICLVIDDSPVIREIAIRILNGLGIEAPEAENAASAIEACQNKPIGAVLLDWDLPSMGALDFLRGVSEMPAEAPSERNRFSRLDPSVLRRGGRVPNALTLSGVKTSPMPRP